MSDIISEITKRVSDTLKDEALNTIKSVNIDTDKIQRVKPDPIDHTFWLGSYRINIKIH